MENIERQKLDIHLPRLSRAELDALSHWAMNRVLAYGSFCVWLQDMIDCELERRAKLNDPNSEPTEPTMEELPGWNGEQMAQALVGSFELSRRTLTPAMAAFVDGIHATVIFYAAAILELSGVAQ